MRYLYIILAAAVMLCGCAVENDSLAMDLPELKVTEVSAGLRDRLNLDPFYKKHVSVHGFPVMSSQKVSDYARREAGHLSSIMLIERPDVLRIYI